MVNTKCNMWWVCWGILLQAASAEAWCYPHQERHFSWQCLLVRPNLHSVLGVTLERGHWYMRASKRNKDCGRWRNWKVCYKKTLEWRGDVWFGTKKNLGTWQQCLNIWKAAMLKKETFACLLWDNWYKMWRLVVGIGKPFL